MEGQLIGNRFRLLLGEQISIIILLDGVYSDHRFLGDASLDNMGAVTGNQAVNETGAADQPNLPHIQRQ